MVAVGGMACDPLDPEFGSGAGTATALVLAEDWESARRAASASAPRAARTVVDVDTRSDRAYSGAPSTTWRRILPPGPAWASTSVTFAFTAAAM